MQNTIPDADDGRLEVATAIAMTTGCVTVNAANDLFTTNPPDLFTRTFEDAAVGIATPDLMRTFLANLKALLPTIGASVDQIPENQALAIQVVARFVRVALLQGE